MEKYLKNKIAVIITACVIALFWCDNAFAASLSMGAKSSKLTVGGTTTIYVTVNSGDVAINNADATIQYPKDLIDVVSISKSGSVFKLWVEEPTFSNAAGSISFNGGVPTPGYTGSRGTVISFTIKAKKAGDAKISFSSAAVRADDGLGTNVLSGRSGVTISIAEKEKPAEAPQETQEIVPSPQEKKADEKQKTKEAEKTSQEKETEKTPAEKEKQAQELSQAVVQLSSNTHPKKTEWYKNTQSTFRWALPSGADAVKVGLDKTDSFSPDMIYTSREHEKTYTDLADGTWYFKVQARKDGVWGPISTQVIQIDTTAPQKNDVSFAYHDASHIVSIVADIQDATSGVDHYDIYINDVLKKSVLAEEFIKGRYNLKVDVSGDAKIKLVAFDKAGNSTETSGTFYSDTTLVTQLDNIPRLIPVDTRLLISGVTQNAGTEISLSIKHDSDEPIILKTTSQADGSFFVLTDKLVSGEYDIWAEIHFGDSVFPSEHRYTTVTTQVLVSVGGYTTTIYPVIAILGALIIFVALLTHFFFGQSGILQHVFRKHTVSSADYDALLSLKKRLEKDVQILQKAGGKKNASKEIKDMKKTIEDDLSEVEKVLSKRTKNAKKPK